MRYNLSNLSKYRSQLMGVATIFIVLCHSANPLYGPMSRYLYAIYVNKFLQFGVDIFLLVSGLGCYFSLANTPAVKSFYIKRATRIFAPFIIFVAIYGVVSVLFLKTDIMEYLYSYSIVSFFIKGDWRVWFVWAILVLYMAFPLIFHILNKNGKYLLFLAAFIIVISVMPFGGYFPQPLLIIRNVFICRIPVFLFGSWIGKKICNNENISINKYVCISMLVLSIIAFTINVKYNKASTWLYSRLLFLPISVSFATIITNLFEKWNIEKLKSNRILLFFGMLSFEIYLIFERVLGIALKYTLLFKLVFRRNSLAMIAVNVFSAAITIILSLIIHKLSYRIVSLVKV